MHTVHVVTRFRRGGTERNMASAMVVERDAGDRVVLAMGGTSLPDLVPPGIEVVVLDTLRREPDPGQDARALLHLRRLLRPDVDVVHTHESKAGILGRLAADRRSTVIHTVHMPSFGPAFGRRSVVYRGLERVAARRTDWMVAVSEELRATYLAAGIGRPERFRVLPSPARVEDFLALRNAMPTARRGARELLGVPAGVGVVLAAAALEPRKRIDLLVTRLGALLRSGAVVLLVAGEGPERPALEDLVRREGMAGAVRLLGHVDPVETAFAAADVFALTSTAEGLAQVMLQALAAGLPVVATPVEGLHAIPGAPITVVDAAARGLAAAVTALLASPPAPAPAAALHQWSSAAVHQRTVAFREEIAAHRTRPDRRPVLTR